MRITGWASGQTVQEYIEASRALVLPSFAEGLPVVLMEALARGRPVISTYVAGIPELVHDGECGWLTPAGSVDAVAAAMRRTLEAPSVLLSTMGRAGRARVRLMHDAKKNGLTLLRLFERYTAQPGALVVETSAAPRAPELAAARSKKNALVPHVQLA